MPNITVADSLKYAHLQMAAEAFLNAQENPDYGMDPDLVIRALKKATITPVVSLMPMPSTLPTIGRLSTKSQILALGFLEPCSDALKLTH